MGYLEESHRVFSSSSEQCSRYHLTTKHGDIVKLQSIARLVVVFRVDSRAATLHKLCVAFVCNEQKR